LALGPEGVAVEAEVLNPHHPTPTGDPWAGELKKTFYRFQAPFSGFLFA
jgi:hypothetical protein